MQKVENKVVVYKPNQKEIQEALKWNTWSKEVSSFEWFYHTKEKFYVVQGEVEVILDDGRKIHIKEGDMAIFERNVKCTWNVKKPIFKHYTFLE